MSRSPDTVPFQELLQQQKDIARDQIAAAWQIHVEQVEEQLHKGWKENLANVFEERFRLLSDGMEEEFQKRLSVKQAEVRAQALAEAEVMRHDTRRALASDLNQATRRLAQAEDSAAWVNALLDALQPMVAEAAFFSLLSGKLRCEAARPKPVEGLEVEIEAAPAFATAVETLDTVAAEVGPNELSARVHAALELAGHERVYLLPVVTAGERKAAGVVLAVPSTGTFDLSLAELFTGVAGPLRRTPPAKPGVVAGIVPAAKPRDEEELALRAQRFARVKVAEMRLYQSQAVMDGRVGKRLYSLLHSDIDRARQQYKEEFLATPGLKDFLHDELISTLANGDAALMGSEYPGALV